MNLNLKTAQNMLRGLAAAICVLFVSAVPAAAIPDDLLAWWNAALEPGTSHERRPGQLEAVVEDQYEKETHLT